MIVQTLATMASAPDRLAPEVALCELDIDSLDLVELTQIVEEEWDVALELSDLRGLETVGAVVEFFVAKLR